MPEVKSIYSFPATSHTVAPLPWSMATGKRL